MSPKMIKNFVIGAVAFFFMVIVVSGTVYTVPEGHVAIVKRWQEAVSQSDPGLNFKMPFADSKELWEIRERKNAEVLQAATLDQLPFQATVSINWSIQKSAVFRMFQEYGSLEQFEERVLDRIMRDAAKTALSKFAADELIANREIASNRIYEIIQEKFDAAKLEGFEAFPVLVSSVQIENISLPQRYLDAVQEEQEAKKKAETERNLLERQNYQSQQAINTSRSEAEAKRLAADAEAYKIRTESEAQADAIQRINEQLARSPLYIELVKAEKWNGVLPTTTLSESVGMFLSR